MKVCDAEAEDKHLEPFVVEKFKVGQLVRVKDGPFAGVEGIVKRYKGQQRIGIVVDGLFTITTAYIAKDKLEVLEITKKNKLELGCKTQKSIEKDKELLLQLK